MKNWKHMFLGIAAAGAMFIVSQPSFGMTSTAADKVLLKDGKGVVEGEIIRETEAFILIKVIVNGVEDNRLIQTSEIDRILRGGETAQTPAIASAPAKSEERKADPPKTTGTSLTPAPGALSAKPTGRPKGAVITMGDEQNGDMVGVYMTANAILRAIPTLEKELGTDKSGVVVFRILSGGGMVLEVQRLNDAIQYEYKPRFRTVAWIESAISAAAMTAHCIEEIYFTSQANYGACTAFRDLRTAVEGRGLEELLFKAEKVSAWGGYNPLIMRAMQIQQPLSATIDQNGTIHFFPDATSGDFVVNREKEILTLNAVTAEKIRFSKGTADSLKDLEKLMGYTEGVDWIGTNVKGVPWPVSRGEKMQMDYRKKVAEDEKFTRTYFSNYNQQVAAAESEPDREARAKFVGQARNWLNKIKSMVKNNPNFAITIFGLPTVEAFEEEYVAREEKRLRDLLR